MNTAKIFVFLIFAIAFISILIKFAFKPISKDYYKEGKRKRIEKLDRDFKSYLDSIQIRKKV